MRRIVLLFVMVVAATACGGGGAHAASLPKFCADTKAFTAVGTDLNGDVAGLRRAATLFHNFGPLVAESPSAIHSAMATLDKVFSKFATSLDKVTSADAAISAFASAASAVDPATLNAAGLHVQDYVKTNCKYSIDLMLGEPAGTTTTGGETTTTAVAAGETTTAAASTTTTAPSTSTSATPGAGATPTTSHAPPTTPTTRAMPPPKPVPPGSDPTFPESHELAVKCHDGDMQSCDDLYDGATAEVFLDYGNTCGGRVTNDNTEYCVQLFGPGIP